MEPSKPQPLKTKIYILICIVEVELFGIIKLTKLKNI